jgi:TRAP-type C4-dicarboxylate transport system permease small subunit
LTGPGHRPRRPWLAWAEDGITCGLTAALVVAAVAQIALRLSGRAPWGWLDPALRHLVMTAALAGAVVATRTDRHIRFDGLTRALPGRLHTGLRRAAALGASLVCLLLTVLAAAFVADERAHGAPAFLGLRTWQVQLPLPLALAAMTYHFAVHAATAHRPLSAGAEPP